jgi:hypothetical protein
VLPAVIAVAVISTVAGAQTATNEVTIVIGNNPGNGTLSGTVKATPNQGVATFSGNSINNAGVGYTLVASAPGLTITTSAAFDIKVPNPLIIDIATCLSLGDDPATDITLSGNNFLAGAEVLVNDIARPATFINANTLTFRLTAEELSTVRTHSIVVKNLNNDRSEAFPLPVHAIPSINAGLYTVTGSAAICANTKGATYSAPGEYGASYYTWTVQGDATIASGNGTRTVTLDFGSAGGTVVLKVVPYNECGKTGVDNSQYSTVNINILPLPTVVTNAPAAVCGPATVDLTAAAVTAGSADGLTFSYFTDAAATLAVTDPTKVGNGIYYIKGTDVSGTGCSAVKPVTVTVISPPQLTITNPAAVCAPATVDITATAITAGSTSGITLEYYTDAAATTPISLADAKIIAASGTYYIKGTDVNGTGCSTISPVTVTINQLPTAPVAILNDSKAESCGPGSVTLTVENAPAGGSFQWYRVENTGQIAITGATAASYVTPVLSTNTVYYVAAVANACESETRTAVTATIKQLPTARITTSANPQCEIKGSAVVFPLTGIVTNGLPTWTILNSSSTVTNATLIQTPDASLSPEVSISGFGTVQVQLSAGGLNNCDPATTTITLVVTPQPVDPIIANKERCGPGNLDLVVTNAAAGYTYRWYTDQTSQTPVADNNGTYTVNLSAPTTTYYVAAVANNCESTTRIPVTATINPVPAAPTVTSTFQRCGPGTLTLSVEGTPANGSYRWYSSATSPTPIANATASSFTTPSLNVGTTTYYATTVSSAGCESTARTPVPAVVNQIPVVDAITGNNSVCVGSAITVASTTTGGVWSSDNNAVATVNATTGVVTGVAVGSANISYTVTGTGDCKTTVTKNISVVQPPNVIFTGLTPGQEVYSGDNAINLTGTGSPAGGTFSGPGVTTNSSGITTFNPCAAGAAGSKTISYSINNGSCVTTASVTITLIRSTYQVLIDADPFPICRGTNTLYSATIYRDAVVTYPYQVDANGQPILGQNGYPLTNSAYPFSSSEPAYKIANAYRYYKPIVVSSRSSFHEDPKNSVIFDYQWAKNNINETGSNSSERSIAQLSSTDYLSVKVTQNQTLVCNVNNLTDESNRMYLGTPDGYFINIAASPNPVCGNATTPVVFTATPNAEAPYDWNTIGLVVNWYRNNESTPVATGLSFSLLPSQIANGDKFRIEFTSTLAGCRESQNNSVITMTVNQPPAISTTGQPVPLTTLCANSNASFTVTATGTALTYQWYKRSGDANSSGSIVPNGGRIAGANSNNLRISTVTAADAGFYYVVVSGACSPAVTSNNAELRVNELPTAPVSGGNQIVCSDGTSTQTLTATATAPTGSSVVWYTTETGSAIAPITHQGVGSKTLWAASQNATTGCISATRTPVTLTINALPTRPTASNQTVCSNGTATQTLTATATVPTGFTVIWYTSVDGSETTTIPTQVGVGSKTYYAVSQNATTTCMSATRTPVTLTINELPVAPTASNQEVCSDGTTTQTLTATATAPTGSSIIWYTTQTGTTLTTSPTQVGVGSTTYYAASQNTTTGCISATRAPVTLTINPLISHNVTIDGPVEEDAVKDGKIEVGGKASYTAVTILNGQIVPTLEGTSYKWTIVTLGKPTKVINTTSNKLMVDPVEGIMTISVEEAINNSNFCFDKATATNSNEPFTPLPVEMLYFTAEKKQNNLVVLEWATAMEKMNEGFQLEVSQDAVNYRTLSFVPTKNGNTTAKQVYTFHDKENGKYGTRYYRIKQMDVDGTSEYFGPKAVQMDELSEQIVAYPNPFTSEVNLEVNAEAAGSMHVIVTNAVGGKVLERTLSVQKGSNKAQLQLNPNLPLGMYIITTRLNGKTNHFRLMKK